MNYLYSNELIGYVDLSDFNKTWPKSLSDICAPKYLRLLWKSKYWSCDIPLSISSQKLFYCPNLKGISQATNRNIEKASHPLLAHQLLIDSVQSVWMSVVTQRLVIQFGKYSHFCVERLAHACQNKNSKMYCYVRNLQFISFTMILSNLY